MDLKEIMTKINNYYWTAAMLSDNQLKGIQLLLIDLGYAINAINNELSLEQQRKESETL